MKLKVMIPTGIFLDTRVQKLTAEGVNGSFGLLPKHVDFVSALAPGILSFHDENGQEQHMAVMEGVLVKKGNTVLISTRRAVRDPDLATLKDTVENEFLKEKEKEKEKNMRISASRIEARFIRRFLEFQDHA